MASNEQRAVSKSKEVTTIAPGLSRNKFIEISPTKSQKGALYEKHMIDDGWDSPAKRFT